MNNVPVTQKLIAIRRTEPEPFPAALLATFSRIGEEARSWLAGVVGQLQALGLVETQATAAAVDGMLAFSPPAPVNSFQVLPHLDGLVVSSADPWLLNEARRLLEPTHLILPNVQFRQSAPVERQRIYRRRPAKRWPTASGVTEAHAAGITGRGVLVGVLDTGIDADHAEFLRKRVEFRYVPLDVYPESVRTCRGFDVDGHGTHVCGILAGRSMGVAPDVDLMVASVIESETLRTSLVRVVTALEEMLAVFQRPEHAGKPIILNMSLGFLPDALSPDDLQAVVKGIERILGTLRTTFQVLPIVAVGNDGNGIVRAPATFADTLSVGAVGDDLSAAPFSGGGISTLSGEWEPNFVGYGVDILSGFQRTQEGISEYLRMSGTSMAAPYVAGIAALYAGQDPSLQGTKLWAKLTETALPLAGDPDRVGGGLVRFVQEG